MSSERSRLFRDTFYDNVDYLVENYASRFTSAALNLDHAKSLSPIRLCVLYNKCYKRFQHFFKPVAKLMLKKQFSSLHKLQCEIT